MNRPSPNLRTFFTAPAPRVPAEFAAFVKAHRGASLDRSEPWTAPPAVLTWAGNDYAGDYVRPDGGDLARYKSNPVSDWNHETPVGTGSVIYCTAPDGNARVTVPVGTTQFFARSADCRGLVLKGHDPDTRRQRTFTADECLRAAEQAYPLVADDYATGVSIEFTPGGPLGDAYWPTGKKSLLERRDAYHFDRWNLVQYAHTLQPINAMARTATRDYEKCLKVARDNRINGKPLLRTFAKAFAPLLTANPRPVAVVGGFDAQGVTKAMPDDYENDYSPDAGGDADMGTDQPADASAVPPTAVASYDAIQQINDILDGYLMSIANSEHIEGKKKAKEIVANIKDELSELNATADAIHDDVKGADEAEEKPEGEGEPDGDEGEGTDSAAEPAEPGSEDADTEGEEDADSDSADKPAKKPPFGKSFADRVAAAWKPLKFDPATGLLITKSLYSPRRFAASELVPVDAAPPAKPIAKAKPAADPDAHEKAVVARQMFRQARELNRKAKHMEAARRQAFAND